MTAKTNDPYSILGLEPTATDQEITAAYRKAAKKLHPDMEGGDKEQFKMVSEAYQVLIDPERRQRYDTTGDRSESRQESPVLGIVNGILNEVLGQVMSSGRDPEKCDIVKQMLAKVNKTIAQSEQNIHNAECAIIKVRKVAARFSSKPGEDNLLANLVLSQIAEMERQIAAERQSLDSFKQARIVIEKHRYKSDQPESGTGYTSSPFRFVFTNATS